MEKESKVDIFEFVGYKFEPKEGRIFLDYKQNFSNGESISYKETIILPSAPDLSGIPPGVIEKALQSLHLILGISYYKFYCSSKVKIKYILSKQEAGFWNTVYKKGLVEFFYKNNLNPKISPKFPYARLIKTNAPIRANKGCSLEKNNKHLVFIGGGKDSLLSLELLKKNRNNITALFIQTNRGVDLINRLIERVGVDCSKVIRLLDQQVFQQHKYNGHIPISAIYAFLGLLYSILYGYKYCVSSNEFSSNFGNIKYKGIEVNHQWSKSLEFEELFQNYVKNFITPDIKYFSLLRPFYEIRIAQMFSEYKKYFPYFSSCNKNFRKEGGVANSLWCGECPKCAFAFLLLSAFLEKEELINIFGKNLLDDKNLLPLFADILGFGKIKPFDCVGTFEESRVALHLARKNFADSLVVKNFLHRIKSPEQLLKKVFFVQNSNIPDHLKFLGLKTV